MYIYDSTRICICNIYITDGSEFHSYDREKCDCKTACNVEEYTSQSTLYTFPNYEFMRTEGGFKGKIFYIFALYILREQIISH